MDAVQEGPPGYTITYRIRFPRLRDQTETVDVKRPFLSRNTGTTESQLTGFARLVVQPKTGTRSVLSPPPAAVDPRPSLVVDRGVAEGLLDRREQRQVAGERCQIYRGFGGVSASTVSAALPTEHVDVCISADGLILEEWHVREGAPVSQRVAVGVLRTTPPLADVTEVPTVSAAQGGGSVLAVDPASEPQGRFFVLDTPPAQFERRGRYSVVPPQSGLTDPADRRGAVASTADVYVRGADVLVVDRGSTLDLGRAFQPRPEGRPIDLGAVFGEGELLLSWTGPEVRWGDADGRFVRVYGTVSVDEVVAVARSLRETPGGDGLVFLEQPSRGGSPAIGAP